ncbi:hypothetical protein GV829_07745 [Sphingomonas lacunae]|uniref:Cystatin domain-containing protein n=1 Tax=Sphingomonas lacunae TaxID=2698828 RepID=A0A6M4AUE6_9SPHN|nr:cystatin domain-containing protein [Sphingomonas lacunae]QJQ32356.1 hypothetical protein GV829_07745 [Sphingomonas lacunae]
MRNISILITAAAATLLGACTASADGNAAGTPGQPEPQGPAVVGGWSTGEVTPDAREAAQFAVTAMNQPGVTLTSIDAVQQQVVAGINYRIDLTLSDNSRVRATVWKKLDGTFELTNISPIISPRR